MVQEPRLPARSIGELSRRNPISAALSDMPNALYPPRRSAAPDRKPMRPSHAKRYSDQPRWERIWSRIIRPPTSTLHWQTQTSIATAGYRLSPQGPWINCAGQRSRGRRYENHSRKFSRQVSAVFPHHSATEFLYHGQENRQYWICRGVTTGIVVVPEVGAIETRLAGSSSDSWRYSTAEDAMRGSTENWPN